MIPGEDERAVHGIVQLLSSKLLTQILSAGDLFQNQIAEKFEEEVENMRHKYYSLWYENLLKARIFLADRHEKVERALQKIGLIPKDDEDEPQEMRDEDAFNIVEVDLEALEDKLQDKDTLYEIYKHIQQDDEEYEV